VAEREQLEAALDYCKDGDVLVVTKLDRLARSIRDLCSIVDRLRAKGVSLRILGMGLDTATANGRLMLNVLGSVAQFEREVMLERQREGIAKAKAEGKFKGRAPTARRKADGVRAMAAAGMTRQVIAGMLGMSERSVYRVLGQSLRRAMNNPPAHITRFLSGLICRLWDHGLSSQAAGRSAVSRRPVRSLQGAAVLRCSISETLRTTTKRRLRNLRGRRLRWPRRGERQYTCRCYKMVASCIPKATVTLIPASSRASARPCRIQKERTATTTATAKHSRATTPARMRVVRHSR
jgi:hypothetical protein